MKINKMNKSKVENFFKLAVCCLMVTLQLAQVSNSFWLTDSSLFSQPAAPVISYAQLDGSSTPVSVPESTPPAVERTKSQATDSGGKDVAAAQFKTTATPPTSIPKAVLMVVPPTARGQRPLDSNNKQQQQQQQQCACAFELLQEQAELLFAKWLASPNFINQLKSLTSNSTGAEFDQRQRRQQQRRAKQQASKSNSNNNNNNNNNNLGANNKANKWPHKPPVGVKVIQGARGPKGDQGARGERGPSGLISVANWTQLFSLWPDGANKANESAANSTPLRPLVFVESEQLLLAGTAAGWQPIQLLAPITRRSLAAGSANWKQQQRPQSNLLADRKRLLGRAGEQSDSGDASKLAPHNFADVRTLRGQNSFVATRIRNQHSSLEPDDDDDDEDDDDDDDEDDEDENQLDDDEFEDDDDDDDDDDEADDAAAGLMSAHDDVDQDEDEYEEDERDLNLVSDTSPKLDLDEDDEMSNEIWSAASNGTGARHFVNNKRKRITASKSNEGDNENSLRPNQINKKTKHPDQAPKFRLVALNEPHAGNLHGLKGANFECKRHAAKSNVKGTFRAFLATNYQNLNTIIRAGGSGASSQSYPIVNLRDELLASSWDDFFKRPTHMMNPLSRIYSFDGRHVASDSNWPNKLVWHGTGNKLGQRESGQQHNCDGWHSDALNKFGHASPLHVPKHYQNYAAGQQQAASKSHRSHKRRFLADEPVRQQQSGSSFVADSMLEAIDRYPCQMPLVVLCIETVAQ